MPKRKLDRSLARQRRLHDDRLGPLALDLGERRLELLGRANVGDTDGDAGGARGEINLLQERLAERIAGIGQRRDAPHRRHNLADDLDALAGKLGGRRRQSGDVAAGTREARHQSGAERIAGRRHDNRNLRRCALRRVHRWRLGGDDDVDLLPDQFRGEVRQCIQPAFGGAPFELDALAVDVAQIAQAVEELPGERLAAADQQHADTGRLRCANKRRGSAPAITAPPSRTMASRRRSGRDARFIARPPPRSVRAAFPHTAPTLGV